MNLSEIRNMSKRDFIIAYVLNRANVNTISLDGKGAAEMAEKAWKTIQEACRNEIS